MLQHRRDVLGAGAALLLTGFAPRVRAGTPNVQDVLFKDVQGRTQTLKPLQGKAVVLHMFTSWDLPSLRSVPELRHLAQTRQKDVAVVGVGMDMEGALAMGSFEKTLKPGYPLWIPDAVFREGRTPFGPVRAVPAMFVVGRDGTLREGYAGYVPLADLVPMLDRALR